MSERSIAIGVNLISYGEAKNGVVPAEFTPLRDIFKGSVAFNFADANQVKIEVEGREDPLAIINRKGDADSIEFSIPSPTTAELVAFCGGTASGDKWEAPNGFETINKAFRIATQPYEGKYVEYTIVNGAVSAKLSQAPGSEQTDLLLVKVTRQAAAAADGTVKPSFIREVKTVTPPTPAE